MLCQICNKAPATVHVTEISHASGAEGAEGSTVEQRHLCEKCARNMKLPVAPINLNKTAAVWKLLKDSARRARDESALKCPACGMTLAEFRNKGRLGCPQDYTVFQEHLTPLLLRIHNATSHKGRLPGKDDRELARERDLTRLRAELDVAIKTEAYENAARLRDQIQGLESAPKPAS
jgi:protein arginine kinase activator